jgi:hypothetical protein
VQLRRKKKKKLGCICDEGAVSGAVVEWQASLEQMSRFYVFNL